MPRARVSESRGAAARTVVPADKYLYVHSRVDIARTWDIVYNTRVCLFHWRKKKKKGKKNSLFAREARRDFTRLLWRVRSGYHFFFYFFSDLLLVI